MSADVTSWTWIRDARDQSDIHAAALAASGVKFDDIQHEEDKS
jgi:hypothetical protein